MNMNRGILGRKGALNIILLLFKKREARFRQIVANCGLEDRTGAHRLKKLRDAKILDVQTRTKDDGKAQNVYVLAPFGTKLAKRLGSEMIADLIRIGGD